MSRTRADRPPIQKVSGIETAAERREGVELLARIFVNAPRPGMKVHMDRAVWRGPGFDPEHTRIVVADGRIVSLIVMSPRLMRFGPTTVPAMTVGPVATHEDYRRLGYNAVATHDCIRYMKEHGYMAAYLQGLRRYYTQFGYYSYAATGSVTTGVAEARRLSLPGRLRKMTRRDIPTVGRLYDRATAGYVCAAVRDRTLWEWLLSCGARTWLFPAPRVICDGRGRPCGYVTGNPKGGFGISEVVTGQDERSWRTALGALSGAAGRLKIEQLTLPLLWGDPFAVFLRQNVQAKYDLQSKPDGGRMLSIIDFPGMMRTLEPIFTERWMSAGSRSRNVSLTFGSRRRAVGLRVSAGRVRVSDAKGGTRVTVPEQWLPGLITGYYAVGDIAARRGVSIPAAALPVMNALFPQGWPVTFRADNY